MSLSTFNLDLAIDDSLVKLLQKLDTVSTVIEGLMSMPVSKKMLEKKINQLEELVAQIPQHERVLAAEWKEKLVCLWAKHADTDTSSTTSRTEVNGRQYRLSENRFGSLSTMSEVANLERPVDYSTPLDSTINEHPRQYFDQFSAISEANGVTPLVSPPLTAQGQVPPQLDVSSERPSISSPTPSGADTQSVDIGDPIGPAIAIPMSDTDLIEQLDRLEVFICTLFAKSPPPVALIEQYLSHLVAILEQLPPSLNEIRDEWLTKIGSFMMQFVSLSGVDEKHGEIDLGPIVFTSLAQLKKDLTSLVFATEKLLGCDPPRMDILERNIGRINEAITLIPSYEVALRAEFNEKVQSLILRWLILQDRKVNSDVWTNTTLVEAKDKVVKPDLIQVIDNSEAPDLADRIQIQEMYGSDDGDEFTLRELPLRVPLTVQDIRGRVAKAFRRLDDPFRYGKTDGIKALICLAAKSRFLLGHLSGASDSVQKDLRDEIYSWAVGKLPEEMYRSYCESTKIQDMNALIEYLCEQQVYCHNLSMEYEAGGVADGFVKTEDAPPGDDAITGPCRYCRYTGHALVQCPLRLMVLCFNCFQYGHGKKCCSNDTIRLYDLVI